MSDPVLPGEGPMTDEELAAFAEAAPERIDCELWTLLDWALWGAGLADTLRVPLASTMVAAVPAEARAQAETVMAAWLEHRGVDSPSRTNTELRAELDRARSECAALAAKVGEFATLQDRIPDDTNGDWGLGYDQGYNAALADVRAMAAPGMPRPPAEQAATEYLCPNCDRWALWTDGVVDGDDEGSEEFWCQTCGSQTPVEDMDSRPQERPRDTDTSGTGSGRGTGEREAHERSETAETEMAMFVRLGADHFSRGESLPVGGDLLGAFLTLIDPACRLRPENLDHPVIKRIADKLRPSLPVEEGP